MRFASDHPVKFNPGLVVSALQARGEQEAAAWLGKLEPSTGIREVMLRTGLSKSGVHKAKMADRLLVFRLGGQHVDHFPLFQFSGDKVREWIPALLAHTGNGLAAAHFLAVTRKRLDGRAYLDLLRQADDAQVIAAMLRHAEHVGNEAADGVEQNPATVRG